MRALLRVRSVVVSVVEANSDAGPSDHVADLGERRGLPWRSMGILNGSQDLHPEREIFQHHLGRGELDSFSHVPPQGGAHGAHCVPEPHRVVALRDGVIAPLTPRTASGQGADADSGHEEGGAQEENTYQIEHDFLGNG